MLKAFYLTFATFFLIAGISFSFAQKTQTGEASYYSDKYQGRKTASGELYDRNKYTAAHRTLPFGALVQVTDIKSNKTVIVKINDMGPSKESRIIDLSYAAAEAIGLVRAGIAQVKLVLLDEYPTASSPYAVGPVIGSGSVATTPSPATMNTETANQRVVDAVQPAQQKAASNDFLIPNIRPASGALPTQSTPSSTMRTSAPATEAQPTGDKGLGLFEFFAQRVSAQGYGVQVGAFSDYRNVIEASATLSNQGINDFLLHTTEDNGKVIFKLIVGPFNSKGAADSFQKKLRLIPGMGNGMVLNLNTIKP